MPFGKQFLPRQATCCPPGRPLFLEGTRQRATKLGFGVSPRAKPLLQLRSRAAKEFIIFWAWLKPLEQWLCWAQPSFHCKCVLARTRVEPCRRALHGADVTNFESVHFVHHFRCRRLGWLLLCSRETSDEQRLQPIAHAPSRWFGRSRNHVVLSTTRVTLWLWEAKNNSQWGAILVNWHCAPSGLNCS